MPEVGLAGIGLDAPHSGTAVYTRALVGRLPEAAPDLDFCLFLRDARWEEAPVPAVRLTTPFASRGSPFDIRASGHEQEQTGAQSVDQSSRAIAGAESRFRARADKLTWEAAVVPLAAARRRQALLHYPHFAAPPVHRGRLVVTVHDLITLTLPNYHRGPASRIYSRLMASTVRRADAIITVSEHARREIVRVLGVPESRITVTLEGADERFRPLQPGEDMGWIRERYGLPEQFFLYLGSAELRKNLETLVRAWALARKQMKESGIGLVIVADFPAPDSLYPDIPALAHELGLGQDVRFLSRVDEDDKPALYRAALAFCLPSRYEGFGLPALEAMASGVPVLASSATSLPEVVGEGGRLLSPDHVGLWADAMSEVAESEGLRRRLAARGLKQAARFSWRATAEQTAAVYRKLLGA